ncbi:MAG: DUF2332 family protein [Mesorhizobium sp.]|uniref:DUF2332 domain-containing protein n=1 Tax=unclassified Mesorhizobium TaxID=325217 RepID=UPI000FCBBCDC|nr:MULTISPECIES: DUF2332 family protein [unclassified Mesorhizobium]RUV74512.1 DUF2332 family protein [Mesorhizobium sp. M5C.F.Cr.IN.023.01.1.1]RWF85853.1 MAG: DUF2332 family protein [Mesorhizobium sp.]RWF91218.1 MAG: DUF2332 family protein [Mesorhizobium sp.]RWI33634.1 MAG: DUF2332 family protein [Mesorhizobium sp.]RWI43873.1 MAG: DUF2332 family protein [Mesorhizobium sp.]
MDERDIRDHFLAQARACDRLGSPFTANLCRALAKVLDANTRGGQAVLGWPGNARADGLALRLCGALHALVLTGASERLALIYPPNQTSESEIAAVLPEVIARSADQIIAGLAGAPQTNEIARSAMLLPGFLMVARETGLPLDLCEIGASAGLNLLFDSFHYRYGDAEWGDPASPVRLAPEVRGHAVPLGGAINVRHRAGCDIAPVDAADAAARLRLRSYVWADQTERLARLDAALSLAEKFQPLPVKADAADFVEKALAARQPGGAFVLYHSIMWQYLPRATKDAIAATLEQSGREATAVAPIARLRMEPRDPTKQWAVLSLTLWPGGKTRRLANCDYHGRWIEWIG